MAVSVCLLSAYCLLALDRNVFSLILAERSERRWGGVMSDYAHRFQCEEGSSPGSALALLGGFGQMTRRIKESAGSLQ